MTTVQLRTLLLAAALAAGAAACGDDAPHADALVIDPGDGGDYRPSIDPADFVATVDHRYLPFRPGARWEYEADTDEGPERTVVEVTARRRTVLGIATTVVRDTVTDGSGRLVEDTFDYYAQDRAGNVWYFGEAVRNFARGRFENTDGSWEAGVDGARPGVVMPARPRVGHAYRQEYWIGEAEDLGEIRRLGAHTTVPAGTYDDVVVTRDWNPLEPDVIEEKYYAPGVGLVRERKVAGGRDRTVLVSYRLGP